MCLEHPGPRCSGHTRTNFRKAKENLVDATNDLKEKKALLARATTAEAKAELQASEKAHAVAVAELKTATINYDESKAERAIAMQAYHKAKDEYHASPEGIQKNQDKSVDVSLTAKEREVARRDAVDGEARRKQQKDAYAFKQSLDKAEAKSSGKKSSAKGQAMTPVVTKIDDYVRQFHRAPVSDEDNAQLSDITSLYPDDCLTNPKGYTSRLDDREMFQQIRKAQGNPNATMTIYRALPKDHSHINGGDWVTLSRSYAEDHQNSLEGGSVPVDMHIVSYQVPAHTLWNEGNALEEWGYDGDTLITK